MTELNSTEAFRYLWHCCRFLGMYPFKTYKTIYKMYFVFISITITFLATLELVVQAFFVESFALLMRNISTSIELISISLKITVVYILSNKLLESHEYLKKLDERAEAHPADRQRMEQVINNCRRIFITYMILFHLTLASHTIAGALNGRLTLEGWLPFDWKSSRKLYIIAFVYQWFNSYYQCIMNLTGDVYSVLYTYVILGHMECLLRRISNIGYDNRVNTREENYRELIRCINDHRNTLSYFDCISSVISGTLFIQFAATIFVLCTTGICVLIDFSYFFTTFSFLVAILLEVLPCCYLVDKIMESSTNLTTALYSCNWMDQDIKFRKTLIIFMQRSQKPNIIMAGNLVPISLPTFMKIIRVSFSMFTLLSSL